MGNKHTSSLKDLKDVSASGSKQPQSLSARGIRGSVSFNCEDGGPSTPVENLVSVSSMVKAQPLGLSNYQKNLLREAWQRIGKKGAGSIGTQIFRRMFESNSDIKKVFQHVTVLEGAFSGGLSSVQAYQHHSELFIEVLDEAIVNIDDLNSLIPKLNEYGAKHSPFKAYGFKAEYWDIFGEAMIAAAREWEGWRKHRETLRAWTLLISFIVDRMRQGYESALRRPPGLLHQYSLPQNHHEVEEEQDEQDDDNDNNDYNRTAAGSKPAETTNPATVDHMTSASQDEAVSAGLMSKENSALENISEFTRFADSKDDEDEDDSPKHPRSF